MGLRSLIARAALPVALVLGLLTAPSAALALDDGQAGPGERWQPGRILVRFADGVGAAGRERIAHAAEVKLGTHLPLVPNLWEVRTRGKVPAALRHLGSHRDVLYVQPDYVDTSVSDTGPGDAAYWPNDPYFWPAYFDNPDRCQRSSVLGGWPLWRQGGDLTASGAQDLQHDPLPLNQRFSTLRGSYPSYHSINVLPAWNTLRAQDRLNDPGPKGWTAADLQRYAIAIDDTGISNHPDLERQVAALFTVVTSKEPGERQQPPTEEDRIREVFRDNPGRDDLDPVIHALAVAGDHTTHVQDAPRPLFSLDDAAVRDPKEWGSYDHGLAVPPAGCNGHGTAVASVAAARANNGIGMVGVGYNVPVVGIRVGMPWDRPGVAYARDDRAVDAYYAWRAWRDKATATDEDEILRFELVKAMHLPVLNMSWGHRMITYERDGRGRVHPVLFQPAVAEALARVLSTGKTLGVAAAGNDRQGYGRGPRGRGAVLSGLGRRDEVAFPCGLKLLPALGAWTSANLLQPGSGGHVNPNATADEPFHSDVNWSQVELLCVAATSPAGEELATTSGRGDSVVQLAAPGEDITVANRPSRANGAAAAYHRGDGTSYAAPMVSGAAALLRRAAPDAPIDEIRRALERGARQSSDLRGKVRYGELDVACALRALNARKQPSWDMVDISPQRDPAAYGDLIAATSTCHERPAQYEEYRLRITTAGVFDSARNDEQAGRFPTAQAWVDSAKLAPGPESPSLDWQARLIGDRAWAGGRAVFPIRPGLLTPVAPPSHVVYEAGLINAGCSTPGYRISGITLGFTSLVKPSGWLLPTDAQPPTQRIQLAVALAKPWYQALLPKELFIRARVRCDFYPGLN